MLNQVKKVEAAAEGCEVNVVFFGVFFGVFGFLELVSYIRTRTSSVLGHIWKRTIYSTPYIWFCPRMGIANLWLFGCEKTMIHHGIWDYPIVIQPPYVWRVHILRMYALSFCCMKKDGCSILSRCPTRWVPGKCAGSLLGHAKALSENQL